MLLHVAVNLAAEAEVASDWVPQRSAEVPVEIQGKATSSLLLDFTSPPVRAFHLAWVAFFLCFCAWLGSGPLMSVVRFESFLVFCLLIVAIGASLAITQLHTSAMFAQSCVGIANSVRPFVNRKALGAVSGIVGAGGNAGAVAVGFVLKGSLDWSTGLLILGIALTVSSCLALTLRLISETQPASEPAAITELAT